MSDVLNDLGMMGAVSCRNSFTQEPFGGFKLTITIIGTVTSPLGPCGHENISELAERTLKLCVKSHFLYF